jgi:hypothetical protein
MKLPAVSHNFQVDKYNSMSDAGLEEEEARLHREVLDIIEGIREHRRNRTWVKA